MAEASAGHPELLRLLHDEIRARGPLSFARFMDSPFTTRSTATTPRLSRLGRARGFLHGQRRRSGVRRLPARQLAEMDALLDSAEPLPLRRASARGAGCLARDVVDALIAEAPDLARRLDARRQQRRHARGRQPVGSPRHASRRHGTHRRAAPDASSPSSCWTRSRPSRSSPRPGAVRSDGGS